MLEELLTRVSGLVEAEVHFASAKLEHRVNVTRARVLKWIAVSVLSFLGLAALMASAILVLGSFWGDQYWLSSLVVGVAVLMGVASWVYWGAKK